MRVPISWLGEWVDLPEDVTLEHLHAALVKVGLEEEDVHGFDAHRSDRRRPGARRSSPSRSRTARPSTGARWMSARPSPAASSAARTTSSAGDKVVVTLPGAVLPGPFPIAARKTYGHVSDGMIASARELGLGDEHDGILRLADARARPRARHRRDRAARSRRLRRRGQRHARPRLRLLDPRHRPRVLALDRRDLPRPRATAVHVDARERLPARRRSTTAPDPRHATAARSSRRASCAASTRPAPPRRGWSSRLRLAGIRSISLTVDITNYVMLELGQPRTTPTTSPRSTRAASSCVARSRARPSRPSTARCAPSTPTDLLVADAVRPLGLAGVMGGAYTEISDTTTDVLIEAAIWDPVTIARTRAPAQAAERGGEALRARRRPDGCRPPPSRASRELLVELAGGTLDAARRELRRVACRRPRSGCRSTARRR